VKNEKLILKLNISISQYLNMPAYINGLSMISPQNTVERNDFLSGLVEYSGDYMKCIDPDYKAYINPIAIRRMSRLIRMGITAAKMSLEDAGILMPDAIITGTGLGSVEDTEKILGTMREDEKFFNPTPFIQSTYNTISSQIAISLKCHGYNSTYVHRNFSFESSLQDAIMQLEEGTAKTVLAGGIDEMTLNHLIITRRAGHWKEEAISNRNLLKSNTNGSFAGEGAGYFVLSSEKKESSYAELKSVKTFYKPESGEAVREIINDFLSARSLSLGDIDLVIAGMNGDHAYDSIYHDLIHDYFTSQGISSFKPFCGEYFTASAFALWMASRILKHQSVPVVSIVRPVTGKSLKHILVYNQYRNTNHTLMLVSS